MRTALLSAMLVSVLAACSGRSEPEIGEPPAASVPPSRAVEPLPPGPLTLEDLVDEARARQRLIRQLEEIERSDP